ncbi:MAG TPA: right-handed parallel beta-helix repeat-containing protein, partial [Phycisphaerae bacterium]|nr:right-handed parallel beta-helix repeat-containing protein [Phycisphaerae bacterium]
MRVGEFPKLLLPCCAVLFALSSQNSAAATLCVNASNASCYSTINAAVSHANPYDEINVVAGRYKEDVIIGIPLSLIGGGAGTSIIDATGMPNGVFVDGYDHPGLTHVTVAGFTIKNAQFEGVLVVSANDVTIRDNTIEDNDQSPAVFTGDPHGCAGQPAFETDETGDCGGGLHLIGVWNSNVSGNLITRNDDGILISDETAETHDILVYHNMVTNNPGECGIVLASHSPVGSKPPHFAPHHGIDHITVSENTSENNGVQVGGSGIGIFSDGAGPGRNSDNVIIHNTMTGNGLGGFALHTHVGPAFGAPADNMNNNMIIGNKISGNLPDLDDTATPGSVGININSGGGGTPVWGTIISQNVITDEDYDITVNTPGTVNIHLNDLLGGKVGVANICAFD